MKFVYVTFLVIILGSHVIEKFSSDDIQSIRKQYLEVLSNLINKPKDALLSGNFLLEDVEFNMNNLKEKKSVCVIDMGGTFFKIGIVSLFNKDNHLKYEIDHYQDEVYPEKYDNTEFWFNWASKKIVEIIYKWNVYDQIDTCSLIFSYPLKFENNRSAFPSAFPKFWCFENKKSKNMEIKDSLNSAMYLYIYNKNCFPKDFFRHIKVRTVLNDSVATYLASKFLESENKISTYE